MKKRMFVALPLSEKVLATAAAIQEQFEKKFSLHHTRWVQPGNFHCTVVFLYDLSDKQINLVKKILKSIPPPKTKMVFEHIEMFPSCDRPEIITIKVKEKGSVFTNYQEKLQTALVDADILFKVDSWKPHITLARFGGKNAFCICEDSPIEKIEWEVKRLGLYQSTLTKRGSVYTPIDIYDTV